MDLRKPSVATRGVLGIVELMEWISRIINAGEIGNGAAYSGASISSPPPSWDLDLEIRAS